MKQPPLTLRRWTRLEYDRLVECGVISGEPLELIGGHLLVAEPQQLTPGALVSPLALPIVRLAVSDLVG